MRKSNNKLIAFILPVSLFILFFSVLDTGLIHFYQQTGFYADQTVFNQYLSFPGGLSEYFSIFLFQLGINKFVGALLYTIMFVLLMYFIRQLLLFDKSKKQCSIFEYAPLVLAVFLVADYSFYMHYLVMLNLMLALVFVYKKLIIKQYNIVRFAVLLFVLQAVAYFLFGGFVYIVFGSSLFILSIIDSRGRHPVKWLLILVFTTFIPLLAAYTFYNIRIDDAYFRIQPYLDFNSANYGLYALYVLVPFVMLVEYLLYTMNKYTAKQIVLNYAANIVVLGCVIFVFFINFDFTEKQKTQIDYWAYYEKWDKILALSEELDSGERIINFQTNRALYHTGRLPYKMFDYPQPWGVDGLILTRHIAQDVYLPTTELLIDMGFITEAVHWANESISRYEYSPFVVEQLVIANIVQHDYVAAGMYVGILDKYLFFGAKAKKYRAMIENDHPSEQLLNLRKNMPDNNFRVSQNKPEYNLVQLLIDNPNNKIVYEYLMSYFLLANNLDLFIQFFEYGQNMQYPDIPHVYQEALMLYMYQLQQQNKQIPRIHIDKDVQTNFFEYIKTLNENKGNLNEAKSVLKEKFGNTYWYYVNYESPVTLQREILHQ